MLYRHKAILSIFILILDVVCITYLSYNTTALTIFNQLSTSTLSSTQYHLLLTLCWILPALYSNLYASKNGVNTNQFNTNTLKVWITFTLFYLFIHLRLIDIDNYKPFSHLVVLQFFYQLVFLGSTRLALTIFRHHYKNLITTAKKIAILGYNETGIQLASSLEDQESPFNFLGILDEYSPEKPSTINQFDAYLERYIQESKGLNVNELYVIAQPEFLKNYEKNYALADEYLIRLKFVPDFSIYVSEKFVLDEFNNFQIIKSRSEPLLLYRNRLQKRVFDIFFSILVIGFILSWLYPLIALLIKLESKGPVIFKQKRSGLKNTPFNCYKFRTMRKNSENEDEQVCINDTRVTRIGCFLRKSSIDEMPQFFNVLLGHMSIIGPRPHMILHTEKYKKSIKNYMVRHYAKPGITGWAQVSGYRGEIIKQKDINNRIKYDVEYIQNWSLLFDLKICALTCYQLIFIHKKAY